MSAKKKKASPPAPPPEKKETPLPAPAPPPEKEETPPPAPAPNAGELRDTIPPPPKTPTPSTAPEEIPEPRFDAGARATAVLLGIAFEVFKGNMMRSVPHRMLRTFAHHRNGEKYDTGIIFRDLECLNRGDHEALVKEIDAFEQTVWKEFDSWVAAKNTQD